MQTSDNKAQYADATQKARPGDSEIRLGVGIDLRESIGHGWRLVLGIFLTNEQ